MRIACSFVLAALFGGCGWVYDQQYEDRRAELDEQRTEFIPGSSKVQFIASAQDKLYWVDILKPLDVAMLHSFNPATAQTLDYAWSTEMMIDEDLHYGSQIIADCTFGSVYEAYDANAPDRMIATTSAGSSECTVDGGRVFFMNGRDVFAWTPGSGEPTLAVNLDSAGVGGSSIGGFAVEGNTLVLVEGGDLWRVDLAARRGTWLMNEAPVGGAVLFDEAGVFYESGESTFYTQFSDLATFDLADAIADGGYQLSFKHPDVHELAKPAELALHGRHLIYRARHGIFAFGLDSGKVVDLLLDTSSEDFGAAPVYHQPAVTSDGTLFVIDDNNYGANETPVYRVGIADRL